jgi:ribosomal protein S18 acetylase RimI-like enzyme
MEPKESGSARIRFRTSDDLKRCLALAQSVHVADGYPPYLGDGLEAFIESPDALAAWIAEIASETVGHVVLNPRRSRVVVDLASDALARNADQLGVIARLLVSPVARRRGIGESLLHTATADAFARNLWPVLDVATHFEGAIALYESCGWTRVGLVTTRFRDGSTLDEYVYVAPSDI